MPVTRLVVSQLLLAGVIQAAEVRLAHDGGELSYDGICYSYRDPQAVKGISLWVPPLEGKIRAVLIFGNPGGGGDTRDHVLSRGWQEWAAQRQMAIAGVACFPSGNVFSTTGADILAVFDSWAAMGHHPELASVPFIPRGSSNAGATAYALTCLVPERIVCFTSNVSTNNRIDLPPPAALQVPGLQHIGPVDPFNPLGLKDMAEFYQRVLPYRPLWAWDAEEGKGHQDGSQLHADMAFYAETIDRRLPRAGVPLRPVYDLQGWRADSSTWAMRGQPSRPCQIAPYDAYHGRMHAALWLPGEITARAYQALATYRRQLRLGIVGLETTSPADGQWNINDSDLPLTDADSELLLRVWPTDTKHPIAWTRLEFFNRTTSIGRVEAGQPAELRTKPLPDCIEQVFTVVATDANGGTYVANPTSAVLRNPQISKRIAAQMAAYHRPYPVRQRGEAAVVADAADAAPAPDRLIAHALSATDARSLLQKGALAACWTRVPAASIAQLVPAKHGVGAGLIPAQNSAKLEVRAVYDRGGLALLMIAAAGSGIETLDWHCSWLDPRRSPGLDLLQRRINEGTVLLPGEAQYQLGMKADDDRLVRNIPRAGFMLIGHSQQTLAQAESEDGIVVSRFAWVDGRPAVQWYLPWPSLGLPGEREQPASGSHLSLVLGANGPEVNLRWPNGRDPWAVGGKGELPPVWGALVLGPVLPMSP